MFPLTKEKEMLSAKDGTIADSGLPPDPGQDQRNEQIETALLDLVRNAEKEDEDLRWSMLKECKRNDYYFNNIQTIFYDEAARDYRTIDSALAEMERYGLPAVDNVKLVNIYRAYAESLIAALSIDLPNMDVRPDDAENPDDIETAETYIRAGDIISKHNAASLMLIKALTIQYNCGTVFGHNYYKRDPGFGVVVRPSKTNKIAQEVYDLRCVNCGELLDSSVPASVVQYNENIECPSCGYIGQPNSVARLDYQTEVVEYEETPKGMSGFDIFGPTHVKVPLYARRQENVGYLILRLEDHKAKWQAVYKDHRDSIDNEAGDTERYERWARIPPEYQGSMPKDLVTGRFAWFRPWYYNTLDDEEKENLLNDEFPNGVFVTVIGQKVVETKHEKLDEHWTISFDPRSNFIHAEPPGNSLVPMQDATTDIFNLGLQSVEYGIPETFVHPKTLNLANYAKQKAAPGMMTNALPPEPGRQLSEGFHTIKSATLSGEYTQFTKDLTATTQFVTGAFPSIFGGSPSSGSDTATEYVESRGRALQRLQLTWGMIKSFWSKLIFKCTSDYLNNLLEDDRFTDKQNGAFVNVWIRKASAQGKVGHVEPEINGQLPQSWSQKKDFIMQLVTMQNPEIGKIILHPSNSELLKEAVGMPEFYIPGEGDRNKQWSEFYKLIEEQPLAENKSSVQIDVDVDDHIVHMLVLKDILVSPTGVQLYRENPAGYQNCIAHYRDHEMANQAKTAAPAGISGPGQQPATASRSQEG